LNPIREGVRTDRRAVSPAFVAPVFTQWPFVKPFTLRSADQFRPGPPPALTSPAYAVAFNEVKDLGATVSKDCGLHVHVGAAGQPLSFFQNLVRIYQAYEKVIDGMMPLSRRNSTNTFCRSLASVSAFRTRR